jgi:competence ComEA-like helix-hairpin-helix protein
MKLKEFIKDYLSFTRKERIGTLVFVIIILIVVFLPEIAQKIKHKEVVKQDTSWFSVLKRLEIKSAIQQNEKNQTEGDDDSYAYQFDKSKGYSVESSTTKGELFFFDPNTISETGWKKLGLRDKTIKTIQNYLDKGGHFYKPEGLQKIYGLRQDEFERLAPYIKIEPGPTKNAEEFTSVKTQTENQNSKSYSALYSIIDINSSDTTAFISLPGIGSKLAARIVNFREKLGGFYSIDQVGETYGLPDSTFQKIKQYLKLENTSLKKININTATVDEMKTHPYIKYSLANPIVAYRNEHGPFSTLEDIKKVMVVTEEVYEKISPYLFVK